MNTFTVVSGFEAVQACRIGSRIDILLADLRMPGMDGLEVPAAVRRVAPWVHCCLMTGSGSTRTAEEFRVAAVIAKPLVMDEFARLMWRMAQQPLAAS